MASVGLSAAQLAELKKYDTPTICNTIELFNVRSRAKGFMDQRIKSLYPKLPPMVGYAVTGTFKSSCEGPEGEAYNTLYPQLEMFEKVPGPAIVVLQDMDEPSCAATYGEIMCTTYKAFGAVGLVTSGTGRDVDQVASLDFPCFVGDVNPSHGYCHFVSLGGTVDVGGVKVSVGELLHGDVNGVTTIPAEIASEVGDAAKEFMAAEAILLNYFKHEKQPTVARFKEVKAEFDVVMSALRAKVRRG